MADQRIKTPRGCIVQSGNGRAELVWDSGFSDRVNRGFDRTQAYVDNEVLRYCSPLVPFDTGMLEKSGILGTIVGSGNVRYIAPYAADQYYNTAESRPYDASRGAKWFERMKAAHGKDILAGAKAIMKTAGRG